MSRLQREVAAFKRGLYRHEAKAPPEDGPAVCDGCDGTGKATDGMWCLKCDGAGAWNEDGTPAYKKETQ